MKKVAYIHGLNSSSLSFGYLIEKFPEHEIIRVNYNSHQPLPDSIAQVMKQLPIEKCALVGHSLGGLIATLIAASDEDQFSELVTISSPLAGSKAANTLRWIPGYPDILRHITPTAPLIRLIADVKLKIPTLSIISTGGHLATSGEPNDSVVTIKSQKALKFGKKQEIKANHFEILMHDKTSELVQTHLFGDTE